MLYLKTVARTPVWILPVFTNGFLNYSTSGEVIVKGVIAKKIPAFVNLKKDKTYSWCSCGLSKKQPFCDGSHKDHPQKLQPLRFRASKDGTVLLCRCKQTNNRPYCDLSHIKTFIPESLRKILNIKL
ncbi:CDGSH iron-sulfur domain-containing protein 3, mitochondrial-like [Argiope bruennichi]|uniref:CDGSH iron-sulfur domain-containing protein like n=1 Tax=Argiope bruennichi TaxID=94029 RepID=A0A8T0E339_ARGBR|nr:CDGSH iron-sulfur domain-containing protein 3, mitochondrial-like [Argiope bruennichi]KAF8765112.1 CDGSH iron-sulfur domain-containing protein like [Argiope bruennichi]